MDAEPLSLRDLLADTKDGDWGQEFASDDTVAYRVIRGADFPSARIGDLSGVPLRFLRTDTVHRRTLIPGDILIETAGGTSDRPTGRTLLVTERMLDSLDGPATCASFCRFLRVDRCKVLPSYLFWYLQYLYAKGAMWEHQVQHTGIARFQYTIFAETVRIPRPPFYVQERIGKILEAFDQKVELNHRTNQTLEAMARAIFKSWFVDFDPVREGHPLFPPSCVDTSIGLIPKGWSTGNLYDFSEVALGGDWGSDAATETNPSAALCIRGADIPSLQQAGIGRMPVRYLRSSSFERRSLQHGDLVLEVSGGSPTQSTGRPVLVTRWLLKRLPHPLVCSNFCRMIRPRSNNSAMFLYYWLRWLYACDEFLQYENGTTGIKNLAFGAFAQNHRVVIPPREVLQEFDQTVAPMLEKQQCNGSESGTLAALRDTLLPKLLSGEIRVNQAEKIVGEAV